MMKIFSDEMTWFLEENRLAEKDPFRLLRRQKVPLG